MPRDLVRPAPFYERGYFDVYDPFLAGYYPLTADTLNSTSGAYDLSVNNNEGTLTAVPATGFRDSGFIGMAPDFNGSTSNIDLGNTAPLSFVSSDFTICAWVFPTVTTGFNPICNKGSGNSASNSQFEILASVSGDGKFRFDVFQGAANNATIDPNTYTANKWYFICARRIASTGLCTLYRDGKPVASNTYSGNLNSTSLTLKIGAAGSVLFFNGNICQFRVYSRALADSEIAAMFHNDVLFDRLMPVVFKIPAPPIYASSWVENEW